jgi:AraC family transcriptional regulator, regulatory protein of adaptative response / DNA-3-methyladenine glycosylase II
MQFSRDQMLERMYAADTSADGLFITAVLTTGIFCLPSCRARKPKASNTVFFANPQEARASGFRACKRCRPEDFYCGFDAQRAVIEEVIAQFRREPSMYRNVRALVAISGLGSSSLHALFRKYRRATPGEVMMQVRVTCAQQALLESAQTIAEIAFAVGFENLSTFNENFRRLVGMSPSEYRKTGEQHESS